MWNVPEEISAAAERGSWTAQGSQAWPGVVRAQDFRDSSSPTQGAASKASLMVEQQIPPFSKLIFSILVGILGGQSE